MLLPTCFRTFQQISWLHAKLKKAFPVIVLPPLPEQPMSAHIDDQDYVERKRLQVSRFFEKIMGRQELTQHADFIHFLSSDMVRCAPSPPLTQNKQNLNFFST